MTSNGQELKNPYIHMTTRQLVRRHKQAERNLRRIAYGKTTKMDFELTRLTFLSISEALNDKIEIESLTRLYNSPTEYEIDAEEGLKAGGM